MDETLRKEIERLLDADVQEELPEAVEAELRRLMADDERRLISLCADITPDGEYGERWFVATDRRLAMLATENGEVRVEVELPWTQVQRLRLRDFTPPDERRGCNGGKGAGREAHAARSAL